MVVISFILNFPRSGERLAQAMWRPGGHSCSLMSSHFGTQTLKSFLKPVTPHLHQVIPFSLSLFLLHAGHLEGSHRDWWGRGRGHDTC